MIIKKLPDARFSQEKKVNHQIGASSCVAHGNLNLIHTASRKAPLLISWNHGITLPLQMLPPSVPQPARLTRAPSSPPSLPSPSCSTFAPFTALCLSRPGMAALPLRSFTISWVLCSRLVEAGHIAGPRLPRCRCGAHNLDWGTGGRRGGLREMAAWSWPKEHAHHGPFPRTRSSWVNTSFIAPELCICQQTPQLSQIVTEDPRALLGFSKCVAFLFSSCLHAPAPPQLTPLTWLHHPTHRNV
jgi:hypothetical protein